MKKVASLTLLAGMFLIVSCVSKKKYVELEGQYNETLTALSKTQLEKEEVENKYAKIEERVANYNSKIQSLATYNTELTSLSNARLQQFDNIVISNDDKEKMKAALAKVDQAELAEAKTLKDSMNLIVSYNLKQNLDDNLLTDGEDDDIKIDINETVVMITISNKLLFKSGSTRVNPKANNLLERLASVINSEPALEVMIEGHTDSQTFKSGAAIKDNWELSVDRSTSIIRTLQTKYGVAPEKLIAAGRSSYHPLTENDTKEGRAINRRTRIVILPNLDKFLALLSAN